MCHGQIVGTQIRTARSANTLPCAICARRIDPGDEYAMHAIMPDDDEHVTNWKLCKRCATLWDAAQWEGGMDYCPLDPRDHIREMILDGSGWQTWRGAMRRSWARMKHEHAGRVARKAARKYSQKQEDGR